MSTDPGWWDSAVVYQIYPRSFCDASGDGIGDLEGVRRHLDHLTWLGVDALWLSPFYPSPMADFGYDVSDYCGVDPLFGSLEDFDRLVAEAHQRSLKVIVDWVPNHSSDAHPWFVAARSSLDDPHRHWYRWRDDRSDADGGSGPPGSAGRVPNNWLSAFAGVGETRRPPAWTWDARTSQWYLHLFLPEQPDLDWSNPEVRAAMTETLRFWMARGVDGFRVDVTHALGKDPSLPDLPEALAELPMASLNDDPGTHAILAELRRVLDSWPEPPSRMMVGEVFLPTTEQVVSYYGTPAAPELHLSFNFPPLLAPWSADAWRHHIDEAITLFTPRGAWPTWVLSNHDQPRHRSRYGSEARARAAVFLLLGLPGTPFLYAGEELGLADATVPADRLVDPGGRDGCRAPIPWNGDADHGWAGGPDPWLPWPPEADDGRTVEQMQKDPTSILWLYRRLLEVRLGSPALGHGAFEWIPSSDGVLAWQRVEGADRRVVAVNFASSPAEIRLPPGSWAVEVASDGGGDRPLVAASAAVLTVLADQALIVRPQVS